MVGDISKRNPEGALTLDQRNEQVGVIERLAAVRRPRLASNVLLWLVAGFFAAFLIWASLTELDRTVRGQGRIIPSSQMQTVSNLEGGIVEEILVKVGDLVQAGDPLVRLDQTLLGSELGSTRSQFDALEIKAARLQAEVNGTQPRYPGVGDRERRERRELVTIERALHASRMADFAALSEAARARIVQAERSVVEAQASQAAQQSVASAARNEIDILAPLVERGLEPRFSLTQAQNRYSVAASEAASAGATVGRMTASVAEARASLIQARQQWRSQAADELARVEAQRSVLRGSLPALADRVIRTTVRTPLAGRVNRVMTATVGGTVRPGDPIAEVVPSEQGLVVEVLIRPQDIGQIRIGQNAEVGISAYPSVTYGTLKGKVVTISPDTTTVERTGETFYIVRVITGGDLLDRNASPLEIGPGMTAEVSLLGEKQSILDYILTPITRLGRSAMRE